jgi:DNA replication and repair protein RecF
VRRAASPQVAADACPQALALGRLTLTDFRCYAEARLDLDSRPVVLTGANGAGKTNLLEAVSFLAPGRGLRRARLADVARRLADDGDSQEPRRWAVAGRVIGPGGSVELGTGADPAAVRGRDGVGGVRERRVVRIDGGAARSQAALAEHISVVWLTPQMDRLFVEGPSARRHFLDRLVYGFDAAHAGRVAAYDHAMRERSRLLKAGGADPAWITALEETMSTKGVAVAAARLDMASRLNQFCAAAAGPFPGAQVAAAGTVEGWLSGEPALAAEDRLKAALAGARRADAETGGAAIGPHRSDLAVIHVAKQVAAAECSTGEQKALLIAIILASARMQTAERGSVPVLLLDEVLAHLDERRRQALLDALLELGAQVWLTGTDGAPFAPLGGAAQYFKIDEGRVFPQSLQSTMGEA